MSGIAFSAARQVYLSILKEQSEKYGLEILGWCLMTNHIHLIARPSTPESLAKAVGRTHFLYMQNINYLHRRSGHLWQNRFYSCPQGRMDNFQCITAEGGKLIDDPSSHKATKDKFFD